MASFHLIPIPKPEMCTEMEKLGFKFENDNCFPIKCYFPPGWRKQVFGTFMRIYIPNIENNFIIHHEMKRKTVTFNEKFEFPYNEKTILQQLIEYGFQCDFDFGIMFFPIGKFEFCHLTVPKDWRVEMDCYITYHICRIFDPNGDKKFNIITDYD